MHSLKNVIPALACVSVLIVLAAGCAPSDINAIGTAGGGGGGGAPASITVQPDASPVVVGGNTFVRATVLDAAGNPVPNVTVTFTISSSSAPGGALNPASGQAITNASGIASVQFIATGAGTMIIQAAVGSLTQSTTITVTTAPPGPPASVVVSASPGTINVGGLSNITATVRDSNGTALSGITVDFAVTIGGTLGGVSPASSSTNASGQASTVFTALNNPGSVTITATAGGVSGTATVVISSLPAALNLTVGPPTTINTLSNISLQAYVTNTFGQPVSDGTVVTFTSPNLLGGTLTATAVTINGTATATYQAANTTGTVSVTASCSTGSAPSDTETITIAASPVGSIQFVSAVPNVIGVKGSGQPETSVITFSVKDTSGSDIIDGTQVRFVITGPNGGEFIGVDDPPYEKVHVVSTSGGKASAILNSGTNAGPVKVTATVLDQSGNPTAVTSSSTAVSIGGGVPSARHFSVSATTINLAGLAYDNQQTTINVFVADRFGNYNILTGTSVSFYTEGGAIDASNVTDPIGATTAMLRTQNPRPVDVAAASWEPTRTATPPGLPWPVTYNPRDGWVKVLVVTRGEEKFIDANGNGIRDASEPFDDLGEPFIDANNNGAYDDLTEAYTDSNGNGRYDRGEVYTDTNANGVRDEAEFYVDANSDRSYTGPNGAWDNDINIWQGIDLVFSGEPSIEYVPNTGYNVSNSCATYLIRVYDINMNTITPGSTVEITCNAGTLTGGGTYTIPDGLSVGPYDIEVTVCDDDTDSDPKYGAITTKVTWKVPGRGDLVVTKTISGVAR